MPDPKTDGAATEAAQTEQPLDAQQLRRLAELIAAGEAEFRTDLPLRQQQQLIEEVRLLLRARLIGFIARQIAWDIHDDRRQNWRINND